MKKTAIILSNINKALAFEWIAEHLKGKIDLYFILMYPGHSELEKHLQNMEVKAYSIHYTGKGDLIKSIYLIRKILLQEKTELVHAHLLDAGLAGLFAAKLAGIKKRIYTRHHATSHHQYHPHAVRYDKWINRMATTIIATSENVKNVLIQREHVNPGKISLIHHGFNLDLFTNRDEDKINVLKNKYNPSLKKPVIGVIARYIELKGIQYIIPAFKKLLADYPDALLILANATGRYQPAVKLHLDGLPAGSYKEIVFENDLASLYHLFDIHIHTPINEHAEAFGQTYIEALAAGIPSVFTMSGVAPELIINRQNALVVPFKDDNSIYLAILEILNNQILRENLKIRGKADVKNKFGINQMITSLHRLYEN